MSKPGQDSDDEGPGSAETKGERTRRRLLEIAVDRFGERGYRATSVSEIARAAGLTQAAVYAYFSNKEDLFDAAVDADASRVLRQTWAEAEQTPVHQLVPMLLLVIIAALDNHPLLQRVVAGQEPEALKRLVELPALDELTESIAARVRRAQEMGEVRQDLDPDLFAGGAEAILLSLLISTTQIGSSTVSRRQLGVLSIFDTVLRPADEAVVLT